MDKTSYGQGKQGGEMKEPEEVVLSDFISVKGIAAKGNQLTTETLNKVVGLDPLPEQEPQLLVKEIPQLESPIVEETAEKQHSSQEKPFIGEDEPPQITLDF